MGAGSNASGNAAITYPQQPSAFDRCFSPSLGHAFFVLQTHPTYTQTTPTYNTNVKTEHRSYLAMATPELEGATVEALEALGLGQLDSLETANTVIGGDLMDLLDTTELPPATVRSYAYGRDRLK